MKSAQDALEDLTILLDAFFQGLSDCGLVSGYNVSLETSTEMLQPTQRCLPLLLSFLCPLRDGIKDLVMQYESQHNKNEWCVANTNQMRRDEEANEDLHHTEEIPSSNFTSANADIPADSSQIFEDRTAVLEHIEIEPNQEATSHLHILQIPSPSGLQQSCIQFSQDEPRTLETKESELFSASSVNETNNQFSAKPEESIEVHVGTEDTVVRQIWEDKALEFGQTVEGTPSETVTVQQWEEESLDVRNDQEPVVSSEEPTLETSAPGRFQCSECHRDFKSASNLVTHRSKAHTAPQCCDMCGQVLGSTSALQEHCRMVHEGAGCFQCNICKKRFMLRLSFRRHLETHEPAATMAVCEVCGKSFRRADYLQRHYMMHSGQRPYACNMCAKSFVCASHLKNHQRARSHCCEMCGRGFSRSDKLKEHMLRHLNVKRYSCDLCGREYAERRDLRKHQLRCQPPPAETILQ
ncbi:hypothetical protein B566_EDAN002482 [Ephemera danica]|nr:hypothetical protein B566_EDAN002482 [Ephemera danica]